MTDKAGWLLKLSGKAFKKQWFVFKPSERLLLNYNKEEDALLGKAPAGFVDMTAYILEREPKPGYEHTVRLVDQNYKPVFIAAEEAKTLDDWVRALTTVGKRLHSESSDIQRKVAARQREEAIQIQKEKEKDEAEVDKQQVQQKKQKRQLNRKQAREAYALKKKSSRDIVEQTWKHEDASKILDLDHSEEREDLLEKIRDKNDPTPKDPSVQKWQRQQKLLDRKQAREKLLLDRKLQKKEEDMKWKQEDELARTQLEQTEEDEDLNDRHELERKTLAEKQKDAHEKLEQKCFDQREKLLDEIQARREKVLLIRAAAEVIAKEGPTKSIKEIQRMVQQGKEEKAKEKAAAVAAGGAPAADESADEEEEEEVGEPNDDSDNKSTKSDDEPETATESHVEAAAAAPAQDE